MSRLPRSGLSPALTDPRRLTVDLPARGGAMAVLEWGDPGRPVDLVFAMAVPEHYTHQHLMLLSELAEIFSDGNVRDALRSADDDDALKHILDHPQTACPR